MVKTIFGVVIFLSSLLNAQAMDCKRPEGEYKRVGKVAGTTNLQALIQALSRQDNESHVKSARTFYKQGDYRSALDYFIMAEALDEVAHVQNMLGYQLTRKSNRNYPEALIWFELAMKNGNPAACYNLGLMYKRGQGVKRDFVISAQLFEKAVELNHSTAKEVLNDIPFQQEMNFQRGVELRKQGKIEEALVFFNKSSDLGHPVAGSAAASIYDENGLYETALKCLEKVSASGKGNTQVDETIANLQVKIGSECQNKKDYLNARIWYTKAKEGGHAEAEEMLKNLELQIKK